MKQLVIDGVSLLHEFGVWISGSQVYNGAEADVETVKIPGRNGDLIYSNRRYNNYNVAYKCCIPKRYKDRVLALRAFLFSKVGYRKIEESYFPNMYRMGRITGNINPSTISWIEDAGLFTITFNCRPQHYYSSGETAMTFTADGTISNDTMFDALPMIRVYGYGTFTLNGTSVTVSAHNYPWTDVDCEIMDAYCNDANLNSFVVVAGDQFPKLSPGNNALTIGNGITKIEITPRYWTL